MKITFDPEKRDRTLEERGLDFADAAEVFGGITSTASTTARIMASHGSSRPDICGVGW
jgi:uncharacterized DUF497 family protein